MFIAQTAITIECGRQGLSICNGDLNLYTRLDADAGDLLHDLRWAVQVDEALVNPHLESVPGLGAFTTRCLTGCDAQSLQEQGTDS